MKGNNMEQNIKPTYRAYFFGNFYLSSIQQGIQSAHCLAEMFVKYPYEGNHLNDSIWPCEILYNWATNHKTMICLNGGESRNLQMIYDDICTFGDKLELPVAKFHEDESLNKTLTCVGIIVPDSIYDLTLPNNEVPFESFQEFEEMQLNMSHYSIVKSLPPKIYAKYSLKILLDKYHLAR